MEAEVRRAGMACEQLGKGLPRWVREDLRGPAGLACRKEAGKRQF